jgi:hypothetical protein
LGVSPIVKEPSRTSPVLEAQTLFLVCVLVSKGSLYRMGLVSRPAMTEKSSEMRCVMMGLSRDARRTVVVRSLTLLVLGETQPIPVNVLALCLTL